MSVLASTSRNVLRRARANVRSCDASSATWHAKCIGYSWLLGPYCFPLEGLTDIGASVGASERDEWFRAAWKVTVAGVLDPRRLVFVDECGTHVSLAPVYGYSARGERVRLKVPRNRGKNTTLLASMSTEGMGPCLAVEGSTTAEV